MDALYVVVWGHCLQIHVAGACVVVLEILGELVAAKFGLSLLVEVVCTWSLGEEAAGVFG